MHRSTIGDFELTVVSDGTYLADGGAFFGVVPKTLWSKKVTADDQNRIPAGLNSLLIRTGTKNILVETGIGNKLPDKLIQIYGQPAKLLDNLHAIGIAPEDIDIVINTHLHFDHCGWDTVRRGDRYVATFPKAKYYVQRGEWEHAHLQLERDAISYMSPNYDPLVESGQMELLDGDREIVPGISVKVFPGHTAHMQAVIVESVGRALLPADTGDRNFEDSAAERPENGIPCDDPENPAATRRENAAQGASPGSRLMGDQAPEGRANLAQRFSAGEHGNYEPSPGGTAQFFPAEGLTTACYISDLIPTTAHLDLTWVMAFDLYPLQTIESRKKYYARAIPERWLTVFTHDHQRPSGLIERRDRGKLTVKAA